MSFQSRKLVRRLTVLAAVAGFCLETLAQNAQWTSLTPLPDGYQEHILVYANGFLYNIGGVSDSNAEADGTNVFYSQAYTNGTIGAWNHTTPLPEAVFDSAGVANNGFIYVIAGNHYNPAIGDFTDNTVYCAKINSDGSLGSWQVANPLPYAAYFLSAVVWSNIIYVVGGEGNGGEVDYVYSASIQPDGSLSTWTAQPSLPYAVFAHTSVADGGIYVLGGDIDESENIASNVYFGTLNVVGNLTAWNQTKPLPQALGNFAAIEANGVVVTMAGIGDHGLTDTCYAAPIAGDGTLRAWSTGSPLPQGLLENAATIGDSYIFESGGDNFANATAAVYSMPLPSPPATPMLTALVTNQAVQLQLTSSTNTGFGILASTNLTCWNKIGWDFTDASGLLTFQDTNASNFPYRFYRAYWPLP